MCHPAQRRLCLRSFNVFFIKELDDAMNLTVVVIFIFHVRQRYALRALKTGMMS